MNRRSPVCCVPAFFQGYDIRIANTGKWRWKLKDWTPNLIITDLSMPR
jgi:hypothetical protein